MGILSAIFLGIAALGSAAHSENKSTNRINSYMAMRCADGFERVTNKELEDQYYRELSTLWSRSMTEKNPALFYPEKWEFFRDNPKWASDWAMDVASERIIAEGFAPWWVPGSGWPQVPGLSPVPAGACPPRRCARPGKRP